MSAFEDELKNATKRVHYRYLTRTDGLIHFKKVRNSVLPNLIVFLGKLL